MDIGSKIKQLRLENGLTQQELANRLELTKGYISQIERNISSPSLETFFSILEVLGTDPTAFFSRLKDEQVVHTEEDFYWQEDEELKHLIKWIVPNALKFEIDPIIIELEPVGKSKTDNPHEGEEFGYYLEREITLVLNKTKHIVKKGQTFYYRANREHYLVNNTNKIAKILWISTPPMF